MKIFAALLCAGAALLASSAGAGVIYNNGAYNGTISALNITDYQVADSFSVGSSGLFANGAIFDTLDFGGDGVTSVDWEIATGTAGSFTPVANGTASVSSVFIDVNTVFDAQHYQNTISFGNVDLTSGTTYWLLLTNASIPGDVSAAFWDENDGPSTGWQNGSGILPGSETFQILGGAATAPEPTTWALMLTGFAGLGAMLRARRGRTVAA